MNRDGGARRKTFYSKVLCKAEIGRWNRRLFGEAFANLRRKMDISTVKVFECAENLFFFEPSSGSVAARGKVSPVARKFEMAR